MIVFVYYKGAVLPTAPPNALNPGVIAGVIVGVILLVVIVTLVYILRSRLQCHFEGIFVTN